MPYEDVGSVSGGLNRSRGSHPVWDSLREELERSGNVWLSDLARWYEADWLLALEGGPQPLASNVLKMVAVEQRPVLESVFSSIDSRYLPLLESFRTKLVGDDQTVRTLDWDRDALQTATGHAAPPTPLDNIKTPQRTEESTSHVGPLDESTIAPATMDFSNEEHALRTSGKHTSGQAALPKVPGYRLHRELGRGGMGVVYLANQFGIERLVAIKMIVGGRFVSAVQVERFKAEARAIGKLQHENIVSIYDCGWISDVPYFSLEYVDGLSLSAKIDGKPLDPSEAVRVAIPLASSLAYAHASGIVHRDLKPGNILLTASGVPKLSDFGLAKQVAGENEYSRTGDIVGTPGYMAPEQARGEKEVGPPVDVYGLGAILYCMLSGRPPFMASNASDTINQLLSQDPIPLSRLQPGVPRDLETICMKCLEKEPEKRYESANHVLDDLRRFASGEPISARPVSKAERAWRWAKRKPMIAGLSATAAVLALILMIGGPVAAIMIAEQKKDVEAAKEDSDRQKTLADANAKAAQESKKDAEKSTEIARSQSKITTDLLKELTFEIDRELVDRPRLLVLRQKLTNVVTGGLDRMKTVQFDPNTMEIVVAGILNNLGQVSLEVGRASDATNYFKKVIEVFDRIEKNGTLTGAFHNKSRIRFYLGDAAMSAGNWDEAIESYKESLKIRQAWHISKPTDINIEQNVAASMGKLGDANMAAGRLDEARRWYEQSLVLREKWVKAMPDHVEALNELTGARWSMARIAFQTGQYEFAIARQQEVIESLKKIQSLNADAQSGTSNVAKATDGLAMMQLYADQLDNAGKNYSQSVEKLRKLVKEDPENFALMESLSGALYGLATVELHNNHPKQAAALYAESVVQRRALAEIDPQNRPRQIALALGLARINQTDEAQKIADQLIEPVKADARAQYDLAGVYAQIGRALSEKADKDSQAVARAFDQANKLLESAKAAGYSRVADLERDPDLRPLRAAADAR